MGWHWGILASSGKAAGAFDLLETTVLSTTASSVTFSNLNNYSGYKHLQIRLAVRSNRAADDSVVYYRLNGDTGSNYAAHRIFGTGSSVVSGNDVSKTSMEGQIRIPANFATANIFSGAVVDVLDFSNGSKNTTTRTLGGLDFGGNKQIALVSGLWNNTNAVTSIEFFDGFSASFVSGSRFSLYGIR